MHTLLHHVLLNSGNTFTLQPARAMMNVADDLGSSLSDSVIPAIWNLISHPAAMAIYVVILLTLVVILIATVLVGESRFSKLPEDATKAAAEVLAKEIDDSLLAPATSGNGAANAAADGATDTETVKETEESRFYMLSELDKESKVYVPPVYDNEITLEELCHRFRHFAAGKLHLYY
ncbi:MAG: hypothetical protein J6D87_00005, partial [Clostridia bacterium]|nr:hypothetical protein [Clostridia bacterium]